MGNCQQDVQLRTVAAGDSVLRSRESEYQVCYELHPEALENVKRVSDRLGRLSWVADVVISPPATNQCGLKYATRREGGPGAGFGVCPFSHPYPKPASGESPSSLIHTPL